jgi:hypothetical protein
MMLVPTGYWQVKNITEIWTNGKEIVLLGTPFDEDRCPNEYYSHNCDQYGCGSVTPHILYRGPLRGWLTCEWLPTFNLSESELKKLLRSLTEAS